MSPFHFIGRSRGYSLLELLLTVSAVAILAVSAIPLFGNIADRGPAEVDRNVVGSVRTGITLQQMSNLALTGIPSYPPVLDNAVAGSQAALGNPFFVTVLQPAITAGWRKVDQRRYRSPTGLVYVYNPANGHFAEEGEMVADLPAGRVAEINLIDAAP